MCCRECERDWEEIFFIADNPGERVLSRRHVPRHDARLLRAFKGNWDVIQKTWMKVIRHLRTHQSPDDRESLRRGSYHGWLKTIATRVAINEAQSNKWAGEQIFDENMIPSDGGDGDPIHALLDDERMQLVGKAALFLPSDQQQVVERTLWMDEDAKEIAEAMGRNAGWVRHAKCVALPRLVRLVRELETGAELGDAV